MNCRNVLHLLSAYMDGELRGVEHRLVHNHLAYCPECEAEYEDLLRTKRLVGRLRVQMPREDLSSLILEGLKEERRRAAERHPAAWLARIQRLLRGTLPSPRLVLIGSGLGVAVALILAYRMPLPDEEPDKIVWDPPGTTRVTMLELEPSVVAPQNEFPAPPQENGLRYGQPVANMTAEPEPYAPPQAFTSVSNVSPYASAPWVGVDARRGWHRIY